MRCTICSIKNSRFWDTVKCNETIPICNIQVLRTTLHEYIYIASSWERKSFLLKSCKGYLNSISLAWSIDIKTITCQNQKTESKTTTWCNKNEWGIVIWLNLQNIQNIWVFFLLSKYRFMTKCIMWNFSNVYVYLMGNLLTTQHP